MNTQAHTFAAHRNSFGAAIASVLVTTTLLASVVGGFTQKSDQAAQLASAKAAGTATLLAVAQPANSVLHQGL